LRARLLNALWSVREWAERAADLRALVNLASEPGEEGTRLRRLLADGGARAEDLAALQATAG
ncbi:MAG: hypothetical protein WAT66_16035, partial [Actinomycetota bacterium]